jgi:hypothetical protein
VTNLFISYRRDDAGGHAGRLSDRLIASFGADRVFMDVQDIEPGQNFQQAIEKTLGRCDLLIAVIGPRWLEIMQARKTSGEDFVRHEISVALALGTTVIPVLVGGAEMPARQQLPEEMAAFSLCQAVEIRDNCFEDDAGRLLAFLVRGSKALPAQPQGLRTRRNVLLALTGAVAAALLGVWMLWPKEAAAGIDVDGEWIAELRRPGQPPFNIRLTLAVMGHQVMGSVRFPTGESPILEGRYVNRQMTFHTSHVPQFETQPAVVNFQARVEGGLMRLTIAYADGVATGEGHRVVREGR